MMTDQETPTKDEKHMFTTTTTAASSPVSEHLTPFSDSFAIEENKRENAEDKTSTNLFMFTKKQDIWHILVASLLIIISSLGTPTQTIIYGKVFEKLALFLRSSSYVMDSFIKDVTLLCGTIMIIGLARLLFIWFGLYAWMQFGEKQQSRARNEVYQLFFKRQIPWFDKKSNLMGELTQTNRCIEELRAGTSEVLGTLVQLTASIIFLLITAMVHSWSLTLIIMASTPFMVLLGWYFGKRTYRFASMENDLTAEGSKILDWSFRSNEIVKLFNGRYIEIVKFNKLVDLSAKAFFKLANAISANVGILRALALVSIVQGIWFGSHMIQIGKLEINQVFTTFSSCVMLGGEISELTAVLAVLNKAQAAVTDIGDFLKECPKSLPALSELNNFSLQGDIEFENVAFEYETRNNKVLQDVSFKLKAKDMNFIIGESGSGKSTIAQLLMKFYTASNGNVYIDGINLEDLDETWVHQNITLIEPKTTIFNQSLWSNIIMAAGENISSFLEIQESIVKDACNFSLLNEFVANLPRGLNSGVSSSTLSGGQQQKIALARAKVRDSPILILDEALSAIDINDKATLFKSIRKWRQGKTTIVITHELNQIGDDDHTIILEGGKIKSSGSYIDLKKTEIPVILEPHSETIINMDKLQISEPIRNSKRFSVYDYLRNPVILKDLEKNSRVNDNDLDERPENVMSVYAILKYCHKTIDQKFLIASGLAVSILSAVAGPIYSYCLSNLLSSMIDTSVGKKSNVNQELTLWLCVVIGISVFDGITHYSSLFLLNYASEQWIVRLRKLAFGKIINQDMSFFGREPTKSAELTALLMNDTRDLRSLISDFLSVSLNLITMLMVGVIWSIISGWKLALVGVSFVPLMLLITGAYGKVLEIYENEYKNAIAKLEIKDEETVLGLRTIKGFDLMDNFIDQFSSALADVKKVAFKRSLATGLGVALGDLCSSIASGTILLFGMKLVGSLEYTQEQLLLVTTILSFTLTNASSLLGELPEIARGQRAGTYMVNLLSLEDSPVENNGSKKPVNFQGLVRVKDVSFKYPSRLEYNNEYALSNVSFDLHKKEITAIVGRSGSGKSTLVSLLTRVYGVESGSINLLNDDLKDIDIDWLRETIAVVPQFPVFFEGTIYENLVYGLDSRMISNQRVINSLKLSNVDEFTNLLPEGLQTKIGGGISSQLSTGQLQRLSIARALIRNPKIMIMDECTSNLDPENTQIIIDLIKNKLSKIDNLTIVLITHSHQVMKIADKLIVMKNGRVSEQSKDYWSLYNNKGEFYEIINTLN